MTRIWTIPIFILLGWSFAQTARAAPGLQVGRTYLITSQRESSGKTDNGSSSSSDRDAITERVIAVRDGGVEVEYALPADVPADQRASVWQFPVRIFKRAGAPPQLLNAAELAGRVDGWLKAGKMTRAACGHWIFTWNAFRIECDPQSVIEQVAAFDLDTGDVRDGAPYRDRAAIGPAPLRKKTTGPTGSVFVVEAAIDPEIVRRGSEQSDLVAAEVSGKPLSPEKARSAHAADRITGTVAVTLETDASGTVQRRTRVTKLQIKNADGKPETRTTIDIVERRPMTRSPDPNSI